MWLRNLPRECALTLAIDPEASAWALTEHLLAGLIDTVNTARWEMAGGKGVRPKPLPRPGVTSQNTRRHGQTDLSREEVLAILRPEPATQEGDDDGCS